MRYLITLILSILVIAVAFHFAKPLSHADFDESFLPKANSVRYIAAGNNSTVAGLLWIKCLTELGDNFLKGREYAYMGHVANLTTELDSLFYTPYYFLGSLTSLDSRDTTDFIVMRRANRIFPEDWRLSLDFAMRLANGPYPNKKEAADVMRPYFDSPDTTIPPHIRTIYRTFELDTMQTEVAVMAILNDFMQPRFKKFRDGFYNKMYRVLGYRVASDSVVKEVAREKIKTILELVADGKMPPQQAFSILVSMKYVKPKSEEAGTSTVAENSESAENKETTANP